MGSLIRVTEQDQTQREDSMQRSLLTSKLKSLNDHLSALLQKKIRIDLEIKRTKKKLSKLKSQSQTYVKTRVQLEGLNYETFGPDEKKILIENVGQEVFEEIYNLDKQVYDAESILEELENLPLYED